MRSDTEGLRMFSLAGQRILVTGASRGLGRGMACAIARSGAEVIAVARSPDQLEETQQMIRADGGACTPIVADLSEVEAIGDLVATACAEGIVSGVVHAAAIQLRKRAVAVTVDEWRFVQRVNTEAPFFLSTALSRRQRAMGAAASHVFIGSLGSSIGIPHIAPYVASKSALLGVVRTLALEWAADGIRVNAIGPGYFCTELTNDLLSKADQRRSILSRIPMSRLGTPEDLAGCVVFLLSAASAYVTGQLLNVDGGWLAG